MTSVPARMSEPEPEVVRVTRVALRDFRNIERADLDMPPGGVVLTGDNGHGKTNVLEAIHFAHTQRSLRGARDQELVRFSAESMHLALEAEGSASQRISVGISRTSATLPGESGSVRRKKVVVDGIEVTRVIDALGAVPSVVLSPRDVEMISGAPADRRRFIDVALGATSQRYVTALGRYRTALLQRNAAIREAPAGGDAEPRLAMWEPALAESGAVVWAERMQWAAWAGPMMTELAQSLGERGVVKLTLSRGFRNGDGGGDIVSQLAAALRRDRASDLRRGMTQSGPHRDDLVISLDRRLLRSFGSSGQQRCAAIALRLIERETVLRRTGRVPLMLLDDPFAELDEERGRRIMRVVVEGDLPASDGGRGQVVLAVPRRDDVPDEFGALEWWSIRDGVISA
ncbi:MAG: DNA replication/repair protein RecF [Gemmatimonadota bacterium]